MLNVAAGCNVTPSSVRCETAAWGGDPHRFRENEARRSANVGVAEVVRADGGGHGLVCVVQELGVAGRHIRAQLRQAQLQSTNADCDFLLRLPC